MRPLTVTIILASGFSKSVEEYLSKCLILSKVSPTQPIIHRQNIKNGNFCYIAFHLNFFFVFSGKSDQFSSESSLSSEDTESIKSWKSKDDTVRMDMNQSLKSPQIEIVDNNNATETQLPKVSDCFSFEDLGDDLNSETFNDQSNTEKFEEIPILTSATEETVRVGSLSQMRIEGRRKLIHLMFRLLYDSYTHF